MFLPFVHRLRGLLDVSRVSELSPTHVRRLDRADDRLSGEVTLVARLLDGDCILCVAGDVIPCCGTVVDGLATARHCASEAAPNDQCQSVLRWGSAVRPGMTVLSNFVIVRVGSGPA